MITISLLCCCENLFYPYEYMDDWDKFSEALLPEKESF